MNNVSAKDIYVPPNWTQIKFGFYVLGEVLSIPCYLFVFYHLLAKSADRKTLYNHGVIVMLFFNFIILTVDLTMTMDFNRQGIISPLIPALCIIHQYVEFGFFYAAIHTMLWISIERHILIFHSSLVSTPRRRLVFHYIPLVFFSLNASVVYFFMIFIYPCTKTYVTDDSLCGGPCYLGSVDSGFFWYALVANDIGPIMLITIFGGALLFRVILQKRRLQQAPTWRKYRKMIIQYIFISGTYIIFDFPLDFILLVHRFGLPTWGDDVADGYLGSMPDIPPMVLSYAILITLPDLKQKLRALIICRRNRHAVVPFLSKT